MKGKQLAFLLLLVVLIGGAAYKLREGDTSSWKESSAAAGGKIVTFDLNNVAHIVLKTSTAELNLVKKDDAWTVRERADYPANFPQVSDLLRKLWDLKTVQSPKVGASQLGRLELVEPGKGENSGTLVDLKDKDGKSLTALLLGKKSMRKGGDDMGGGFGGFPNGRYVMPVGGAVSLISESLEDADPKPEKWLVKDFIRIDNPKSIALAGQTDALRWKITRADNAAEWKLADAKPEETLDASKATTLSSQISSPSFTDVLAPDAKPEETGLDKPAVATIETFDNFTYILKIGKVTGESYPVLVSVAANLTKERTPGQDEKPEDKTRLDAEFQTKLKTLEDKLAAEKKCEQRPYSVAKFTIEALLKERTALLAEKKPEPAPAATPPMPPTAPRPIEAVTPPIEAVTPPVSVPPMPAKPTDAAPTPAPPPPAKPPEIPPALPATPPTPPPAPEAK